MSGIETALLVGSTALGAVSAVAGGLNAAAGMRAEAEAMERRAGEERGAASREAIRRSREARLVLSRQQAVAAASGGGATDSTVLDLMGDTAAEGAYQSASAIYEGEARGRGLEDQAAISRMKGRQARLSGFMDAGTTMLSGGLDWARYRPGGSRAKGGGGMPSFYPRRA